MQSVIKSTTINESKDRRYLLKKKKGTRDRNFSESTHSLAFGILYKLPTMSSLMQTRWWEKVEEDDGCIWYECVTDDGLPYYCNSITKETTWDKPEELMTAAELADQGEWLWIPDDKNVYIAAKLLASKGSKHRVEVDDAVKTVKAKRCFPCNKYLLLRVVPDLTLLDDMSEPLILHNLKQRFEQQSNIYTEVGTILIALNPYTRSLDLYSHAKLRRYRSRKMGEQLPPHIFNIAYDAYYGITSFQKAQSIVVSGESGAGKTEATKQCLQYLAAVAGSSTGVEKKILKANPILESFGNAKTVRNDNSSRFGKYIEIMFDKYNRISGSATSSYLLEKIRVVQQSEDERNFHIFYQLCVSASKTLQKQIHLVHTAPRDYNYLKMCTDVPSIDDAKDFDAVEDAMKELGFQENEKHGIFCIISAILSLGNIRFVESKKEADKSELDSSTHQYLKSAAAALHLPNEDSLMNGLVKKTLRIANQETTFCNLTTKQASDTRHALSKFIYEVRK